MYHHLIIIMHLLICWRQRTRNCKNCLFEYKGAYRCNESMARLSNGFTSMWLPRCGYGFRIILL